MNKCCIRSYDNDDDDDDDDNNNNNNNNNKIIRWLCLKRTLNRNLTYICQLRIKNRCNRQQARDKAIETKKLPVLDPDTVQDDPGVVSPIERQCMTDGNVYQDMDTWPDKPGSCKICSCKVWNPFDGVINFDNVVIFHNVVVVVVVVLLVTVYIDVLLVVCKFLIDTTTF